MLYGEVVADVLVVELHVPHEHGPVFRNRAAGDGFTQLDRPLLLVGLGFGLRCAQDELTAALVEQSDRADSVVKLLRGQIHQKLENFLQVRALSDGLGDLAKRSQPVQSGAGLVSIRKALENSRGDCGQTDKLLPRRFIELPGRVPPDQ